MWSYDFLFYVLLGFLAQLIDGALGMAYGLIVTTTLLASGAPPAIASASVHAAEIVTTGLAGGSHVWNRNVDWQLLKRLAPAGVAGGVAGAYILVGLPESWVKIFVVVYLMAMTVLVARRLLAGKRKKTSAAQRERKLGSVYVGAGGGLLDAVGGGGWGPIVSSTLLVRGDHPRLTLGTASLSEFAVTIAVSAAFAASLDLSRYWLIVVGLIAGGAIAAPFAGILIRILPARVLILMVAVAIGLLSVFNLVQVAVGWGKG